MYFKIQAYFYEKNCNSNFIVFSIINFLLVMKRCPKRKRSDQINNEPKADTDTEVKSDTDTASNAS